MPFQSLSRAPFPAILGPLVVVLGESTLAVHREHFNWSVPGEFGQANHSIQAVLKVDISNGKGERRQALPKVVQPAFLLNF